MTLRRNNEFDDFLRAQYEMPSLAFLSKKVDPAEALLALDPDEYEQKRSAWEEAQRQLALGRDNVPREVHIRNAERFDKVAALAARSRLVPYIGAGVSASYGLPTWTSYLNRLGRECGIESKVAEWLAKGQYEEAADRIHRKLGEAGFGEAFDRQFGKSIDTTEGLAESVLAFCGGPVVTTNFDRILETSPSSGFEFVFLGRDPGQFQRASREGSRVLLKVHGSLYHAQSRVLTKAEYSLAYGPRTDASTSLVGALKSVYLRDTLLFVGCSLLLDRTMQLFYKIAQDEGKDEHVRHYAIVELPRDAAQLPGREKFLNERRIFPIWYPHNSHGHVASIVRALVDAAKELK